MNDSINGALEHARHHFAIADIASDGRHLLAGNFLDALDRFRRAVAEVIQTYDVIAAGKQLHHRMRTDVTRTSGNQHGLQDVMRNGKRASGFIFSICAPKSRWMRSSAAMSSPSKRITTTGV